MLSKEQIVDILETLNSQVLNEGFYQYYLNIIVEDIDIIKIAKEAARIGCEANFKHFPQLSRILMNFEKYVREYENLPKTYSEEELEHNENVFVDKLELIDDTYYLIEESISEKIEEVAELMIVKYNKQELQSLFPGF